MKFNEAVQAMKSGESVTRARWPNASGYLVLMPGMQNIWRITIDPIPNAGNNLFSVEDYDATDWQISDGSNVDAEEVHAETCS